MEEKTLCGGTLHIFGLSAEFCLDVEPSHPLPHLGLVPCLACCELVDGRAEDALPFAAALSVVLMVLTSLLIALYRKVAGTKQLEGLI